MTLSTVRGSIGRVRNMYIVFAAAVASSDIAFYIAATHGGKEVAAEIMENLRLCVAGLIVVYYADVLGTAFGPGVLTAKQLQAKFKEKEGNLGGKAREFVRAAFSGAFAEVIAYGVLFDAW